MSTLADFYVEFADELLEVAESAFDAELSVNPPGLHQITMTHREGNGMAATWLLAILAGFWCGLVLSVVF